MRRGHLASLLASYDPADERELEYLGRMRALVESGSAFDRASYVPGHFTASAFVLSPEGDALLLILHRKLGIWIQPGGHVEPDDSDVFAAAVREVREEVGLHELTPIHGARGLFDIDIHRIPARKAEPEHEHFDVRFAFLASSRSVISSAEVGDMRWVELDGVKRVTADPSVIRAVEKLTRAGNLR